MPYDQNGNWTSVVPVVNGTVNPPAPPPTNHGNGPLTAANALALVQKEVG